MFFSRTTGAFYDPGRRAAYEAAGTWPEDAVEVPDDEYRAALSASYGGFQIGADADGRPIVVNPQPPSDEQKWSDYRSAAKTALSATDVTVNRITEAVSLGYTSWDAPDVVALMGHRRDLRAILSQPQPEIIPDQLPAHPGYPAGT